MTGYESDKSGRGLKINLWLGLALIAASVAFLVDLGGHFLEDWRVQVRSLIALDAPPSPALIHFDGHTLSVTGAIVREIAPDQLTLWAWAPTPSIQVIEPGASDELTVQLANLPLRLRLDASGPVEENRSGPIRSLRFSPKATRQLGFTDWKREVTFAVLGDTGDSATFSEALRIAARDGADFLLHVGDLIYRDEQMPNIERILVSSPLPVFVMRGNHDYRNAGRVSFMRRLSPPYYAFRMGEAAFIILDTGGNYLPSFWQRSTQCPVSAAAAPVVALVGSHAGGVDP